jgi:glycosyltransferase involved in cell wall biosynthesis
MPTARVSCRERFWQDPKSSRNGITVMRQVQDRRYAIVVQGVTGGIWELCRDLARTDNVEVIAVGHRLGLRPKVDRRHPVTKVLWVFPFNYLVAAKEVQRTDNALIAAGFWPLLAIAFAAGANYVYWDHGPQVTYTRIKAWLCAVAFRWGRRPDGAIFCSRSALKFFFSRLCRTNMSAVVCRNWTGRSLVDEPIEPLDYTFTVLSRLDLVQKDVLTVVHAFSRVLKSKPEARLHICGDGRDRDRVISEIGRLKIESAVQLHGYVEDPGSYIRRSVGVIVPGRWEGQSIAIVEALKMGRVPIVPDLDANLEMLPRGVRVGVYTSGSASSLAEKMESVGVFDPCVSERCVDTYRIWFDEENKSNLLTNVDRILSR